MNNETYDIHDRYEIYEMYEIYEIHISFMLIIKATMKYGKWSNGKELVLCFISRFHFQDN